MGEKKSVAETTADRFQSFFRSKNPKKKTNLTRILNQGTFCILGIDSTMTVINMNGFLFFIFSSFERFVYYVCVCVCVFVHLFAVNVCLFYFSYVFFCSLLKIVSLAILPARQNLNDEMGLKCSSFVLCKRAIAMSVKKQQKNSLPNLLSF